MAGSGNLNQWLSTKKRGRDDEKIEQAKEEALARRRAKMTKKKCAVTKKPAVKNKNAMKKGPAKRNTKRVAPATKKRKALSDDEEDYEDEEDELSENSDSDEEEEAEFDEDQEESDDDNDDEISLHDSSGDDLSDGEEKKTSSFFPKGRNKNYKVKPMLAQVKKQKAQNRNKAKGRNNEATRRTKKPREIVLEDSDDDAISSSGGHGKKPAALPAKRNDSNRPIELDLDSSSDDDKAPAPAVQPEAKPAKRNQAALRIAFSDGDDTPVVVRTSKAARKTKLVIDDDDDNDNQRDEYEDDDESMAIAMKQSLLEASQRPAKTQTTSKGKLRKKFQQKKKPGTKKNGKKTNNQDEPSSSDDEFLDDNPEVIAVDEEPEVPMYKSDPETSSDEEGEDDNDQDVFMDDEAREASKVLETANELSASVVRIMVSWAAAQNGDGDDSNKNVIPQGIIVDGAVVMSSLTASASKDSTPSTMIDLGNQPTNKKTASEHQQWISNEVMKEILPNVTLSDYQLIGVNWLALLNGMTCTIEGAKSKRKTNVNGVLADEMGLGKTCQTIAFLAWLKHKRQTCKDRRNSVTNGKAKAKKVVLHDNDDDDGDGLLSEEEAADETKNGRLERTVVTLLDDDDDDWVDDACCPHLVVVPASVLSNWEREFERFAPQLNVIKYHGSMDDRMEIQRRLRPFLRGVKPKDLPSVDAILTSVTYFQKEQSDDRNFLKKFTIDYMVVDEAHQLKNANSLRFRSMDKFKSKHRLLLTGTPVQNSPKELMSLLCFLMPLFNRRGHGFDDSTENDGGESMLQHFVCLEGRKATNAAEDANATAYAKLKQLFAPFVLRRRKADVLSQILPNKVRRVEFLKLDDAARKVYDSIMASYAERKRQKAAMTDHAFTQLRKAANHPLMLRTRYTSPAEIDHLAQTFFECQAFKGDACSKARVAQELEKFSDFEIHLTAVDLISENRHRAARLERYVLKEEDLFCSAKFVRLRTLLPELIASGHRILIFSVWTTSLDLLGCLLEHMNLKYMRLDGQTPVEDRQSQIDEFNHDDSIPIYLLSTKAGGVGINLTAADTVIMHDLDFNPFNDLQAEDRCHRIGQKKEVTVIKFVALDTVDKEIYDMQERKAKMNAAIMESPDEWKKEEKKAKKLVLQAAVDRYLQSPQGGSSKSDAAQASNVEKENYQNQNVIDLSSPIEECRI